MLTPCVLTRLVSLLHVLVPFTAIVVTSSLADDEPKQPGTLIENPGRALGGKPESLFFVDDGKTLVVRISCQELIAFDVATSKRIWSARPAEGFYEYALSRDGRLLAFRVRTENGSEIRLWDVVNKKTVKHFGGPNVNNVTAFAFSNDASRLLMVGEFGFVRLFDVATGKQVWATDLRRTIKWPNDLRPPVTTPTVTGAAIITPDEKQIAVVNDRKLVILSFQDGKVIRELAMPKVERLWAILIGKDAKTLFVAHYDGIDFINFETGEVLHQIWARGTTQFALSPCGKFLVYGTQSNVVIYDLAAKKTLLDFYGKMPAVFSADGKKLAVPRPDRNVTVVDMDALLKTLKSP